MNTNSASKKVISMVCLIAGIVLLAVALIQDISKTGAGWRGQALIIGAICVLLGMYLFPTLKHHICVSAVVYLCGNSNHSIMFGCILFLYRLEWNPNERICRICKL